MPFFESLKKELDKNPVKPQHVLFSATIKENTQTRPHALFGDFTKFLVKKESLKLNGVKHFKMQLTDSNKLSIVSEIYKKFADTTSMIFVNKKKTAQDL